MDSTLTNKTGASEDEAEFWRSMYLRDRVNEEQIRKRTKRNVGDNDIIEVDSMSVV